MFERLRDFCRGERGTDLVEYALLVAFVTLASAALFLGDGPAGPHRPRS